LPNVNAFTVGQRMVVPSGETLVMLGYDQAQANSSNSGSVDGWPPARPLPMYGNPS
jgi:hypothetical protein